MAIGNIDSMSSMLARMTPQQRQQYAMMHHNDPFVVSLAKFVNDVEQQKAQAMQSQRLQAMPPMPPVVDQEIAAMAPQRLPEAVGIGALPERSMANMAGGGITGEDDGVEHYAVGGTGGVDAEFRAFLRQMGVSAEEFIKAKPEARTALKDMFESQRTAAPAAPAATAQAAPSTMYRLGAQAAPYISKAKEFVKAGTVPVIGGGLAAAQGVSDIDKAQGFYDDPNVPTSEKIKQFLRTGSRTALPYIGGVVGSGVSPFLGTAAGAATGAAGAALIDPEGEALKQYLAQKAAAGASDSTRQTREELFRNLEHNAPVPATPTGAAPTAGTGAVRPAGAATGQRPPATPATATAAVPATGDLISQFEATRRAVSPADPAAAERAGLQTLVESRGPEALAEFEAAAKKREGRYAGREERINKQEAELAKESETNTGLALLAAAGAMLKPGGFAAGAANAIQAAIPQFITGRERINAARNKLEESRDKMEELRFASEDMTDKERRDLKKSILQDAIDFKKYSIDSIMERDKVGRDEAKTIFDNQIKLLQTQMEQAGALQRTNITAGATIAAARERSGGLEELRLAQLAENVRKNIEAGADKITLYRHDPVAREAYIKQKMQEAVQGNPKLAEYLGVTGGGGVTLPPGVTVNRVGG